MLAGEHDQRAEMRHLGLAVLDGLLVQCGSGQVPVLHAEIAKPVLVEAILGGEDRVFCVCV